MSTIQLLIPEQLFPIGTKVGLRYRPDSGELGVVTGYVRGKVIIHWPDWGREGKYQSCSLIAAEVIA